MLKPDEPAAVRTPREVTPGARRLRAALGFLQLEPTEPELRLLHRAFDSWRGLGLLTTGMQRAGWDLQLTAHGDGHWRATFYVTGMAHSIVGGSAWEATAWRAVQRAGWAALASARVS